MIHDIFHFGFISSVVLDPSSDGGLSPLPSCCIWVLAGMIAEVLLCYCSWCPRNIMQKLVTQTHHQHLRLPWLLAINDTLELFFSGNLLLSAQCLILTVMQLLVQLTVFLFGNVLTVPETITNIDNTFWDLGEQRQVAEIAYIIRHDYRHKLHMTWEQVNNFETTFYLLYPSSLMIPHV